MKKRITIIGGGVIGLSLAYALMKEGAEITLIDQEDGVGLGASFANGAQLSYRYVSPLADQGVPLQGLKWLGKSDSPLNLRLRFSFAQWQWLLKFTLACNQKTNRINGDHILRLSLLSQSVLEDWRLHDHLDDFCWQQSGKMIIHRHDNDFKKAAAKIDPYFQEVLTPSQACQKEPSLKHIESQLKGAIYAPKDETADAYLYCIALLNKLQSYDGFTLLNNTQVLGIHTQQNKVTHLTTSKGEVIVEELVIATGNGTTELLNPIKIKLPIYPLQGYSLTVPFPESPGIAPNASVTDYGHKTVYAKLGNRLRVAAMVDIGYDGTMRKNRISALRNIVSTTFPRLKGLNQAETWVGLRPSTPEGPPILGKTDYRNLWLNVGHGSLGFTLAAGSATVLASLLLAKDSPIELSGLSL